MTKRPTGWENSSLSDFLDQAHSNTLGTFQQHKRLWMHLGRINEGFDKLTPHLYNTPDMLSALLYTRSHGAFLAATRLAVATQTIDVYPLLRSAIEYAIVSLYFKHHLDVADLWMRRNESAETKKKVQNKTHTRPMLRFVKTQDVRLGNELERLYEASIDHGAHPNVSGFLSGIDVDSDLEGITINTRFLTDEARSIDFCLYMTGSVGVSVLAVAGLVFEDRVRIISLDKETSQLKNENREIGRSFIKKHEPRWRPFL